MDEVLKRLLEVEGLAAQVVANAKAEAERLLDDGRREALAEGQRLQAAQAEERRRVIAERLARAEREKADTLRTAEQRLQARARTFAEEVRARADQVRRALAYPLDATGH